MDECWWCGSGRQTREHLFKECIVWRKEVRKLWKEMRLASRSGKETRPWRVWKGREDFGYQFQCGARPGNATERTVVRQERHADGVPDFLSDTKAGTIKAGIIAR